MGWKPSIVTCRIVPWLIRRVSNWMIGFIAPYPFTQLGTAGSTGLSLFYTLYSSPLHTLEFSVFTGRILATDLSKSNFKSHMKSTSRSLISVLPLFCNCQLNPIPLLPSSYPGRLASRNSTLHFSSLCCWTLFITTLHGPRRKQSLYC
jgi:hypothetical protein